MKVLITESQFQTAQRALSDLMLFQVIEHAITQFKRWHHYTTDYPEHEALGDFYEQLSELLDGFMETFIGVNGRNNNEDFAMQFKRYDRSYATEYLDKFAKKLYGLREQIPQSDMQNTMDEMIGLANHTKYLLTLK
jgi:hypothetical protein